MIRAFAPVVLALLVGCPPPPAPPSPPESAPVNDAVTWESPAQRKAEQRALTDALKQALPSAGGGRVLMTRCRSRPCLAVIYGKAAQQGRDRLISALSDAGFALRPKGRAGPAGKGYDWVWVISAARGGIGPDGEAAAKKRIPSAWAEAIHLLRPTQGP